MQRKSAEYQSPTGAEAEVEPGSRGRVLRNKLGIKRKQEMDRTEYAALLRAQATVLEGLTPQTRFAGRGLRTRQAARTLKDAGCVSIFFPHPAACFRVLDVRVGLRKRLHSSITPYLAQASRRSFSFRSLVGYHSVRHTILSHIFLVSLLW